MNLILVKVKQNNEECNKIKHQRITTTAPDWWISWLWDMVECFIRLGSHSLIMMMSSLVKMNKECVCEVTLKILGRIHINVKQGKLCGFVRFDVVVWFSIRIIWIIDAECRFGSKIWRRIMTLGLQYKDLIWSQPMTAMKLWISWDNLNRKLSWSLLPNVGGYLGRRGWLTLVLWLVNIPNKQLMITLQKSSHKCFNSCWLLARGTCTSTSHHHWMKRSQSIN